jgi:hypothetical protein
MEVLMVDLTMEAVVKAAIAENGRVYPSAVADVLEQFRAGRFKANETSAFLEKIETDSVGLTPAKPHWFIPKAGSDEDLARQAFLFGNSTSQGAYVRKFGSDAAKAEAARYNNPYADGKIGKPGIEPDDEKVRREGIGGRKNNPWANIPENIDPKTGMYNARAVGRMASITRALGATKAAELAAACGATLGSVRPPRQAA